MRTQSAHITSKSGRTVLWQLNHLPKGCTTYPVVLSGPKGPLSALYFTDIHINASRSGNTSKNESSGRSSIILHEKNTKAAHHLVHTTYLVIRPVLRPVRPEGAGGAGSISVDINNHNGPDRTHITSKSGRSSPTLGSIVLWQLNHLVAVFVLFVALFCTKAANHKYR